MYWLADDRFAKMPELVGHVPIASAFAQIVAVECDEDPLDVDRLQEVLACASCAQQESRWLHRLLQSGRLRAVSRPIGGGPVSGVPLGHWQADEVANRFVLGTYNRSQPFDPAAEPDHWIFLNAEDLELIWIERRDQRLASMGDGKQRRATASSGGHNRAASERASPSADWSRSNGSLMLGLRELEDMIGLKKSTIYKMIDEGSFPKQLKVGGRSLWKRHDIEAWIARLRSEDVSSLVSWVIES